MAKRYPRNLGLPEATAPPIGGSMTRRVPVGEQGETLASATGARVRLLGCVAAVTDRIGAQGGSFRWFLIYLHEAPPLLSMPGLEVAVHLVSGAGGLTLRSGVLPTPAQRATPTRWQA